MLEKRAKQFAQTRRSYRLAMSEQCGKLYAPILLILCGEFIDPDSGTMAENGVIVQTLLREHRSNASGVGVVLLSDQEENAAQKIAAACSELLKEPDYILYHYLCVNYIGDAEHMKIETLNTVRQAVVAAVFGAIPARNIYWNIHTVLKFPCADLRAASSFLHDVETQANQTDSFCSSFVYGNVLHTSGRSIDDPQNIYKAIGANLIVIDFDASSFNQSFRGHRIVGYAQADIRAERMFKIGFAAFSEQLTELLYGHEQQVTEVGLFDFGLDAHVNVFKQKVQDCVQMLLRSESNLCCPKDGLFPKWKDVSSYEKLLDCYFDVNLRQLCVPHSAEQLYDVMHEALLRKCREVGLCLTKQLFERFASEMFSRSERLKLSEQALHQAHAQQVKQAADVRSRAVSATWERMEYDAVCSAITMLQKDNYFEKREAVFRQIRIYNQELSLSVKRLPNQKEIAARIQIVFSKMLQGDRASFQLDFDSLDDYLDQAMSLLESKILRVVVPPDRGYKEELAKMDEDAVKAWTEELLAACDTSVILQDAVQCDHTYMLLTESDEVPLLLLKALPDAARLVLGGSCSLRLLHYTAIRSCTDIFMVSGDDKKLNQEKQL